MLRNDDGLDELVAFLVGASGARSLDPRELRATLRERLPSYMVPARFEVVDDAAAPLLRQGRPQGAEERGADSRPPIDAEEQEEPRTDTEATLLDAAKRVLPPAAHPLRRRLLHRSRRPFAARRAFRLGACARRARSPRITLQDVYAAAHAARAWPRSRRQGAGALGTQRDLSFEPPPLLRRFLCGLAQAVALPFILALRHRAMARRVRLLHAADRRRTPAFWQESRCAARRLCAASTSPRCCDRRSPANGWSSAAPSRAAIRFGASITTAGGWRSASSASTHMKWFQGSPLMRDVSARARREDRRRRAHRRTRRGRDRSRHHRRRREHRAPRSSSPTRASIGNELIIGPIDIGDDAYIGTSCVIEDECRHRRGRRARGPDRRSRRHAHRRMRDLGRLARARKVGMVDAPHCRSADASAPRGCDQLLFYTSLRCWSLPPLGLLPIFPAFWVFDRIDNWIGIVDVDHAIYLAAIPLFAWPTAFVLVLVTVGLHRRCAAGSCCRACSEGTYSIYSWLLFAQMGRGAGDRSDAGDAVLAVRHDLHAHLVSPDGREDRQGCRRSRPTSPGATISSRSARNASSPTRSCSATRTCAAAGCTSNTSRPARACSSATTPSCRRAPIIPEGALIGIKSKPPANELISPGDTWFGSPPIKLPVRQKFDGGGANWTYEPPFWKQASCAPFRGGATSRCRRCCSSPSARWARRELRQRPLLDGRLSAGRSGSSWPPRSP